MMLKSPPKICLLHAALRYRGARTRIEHTRRAGVRHAFTITPSYVGTLGMTACLLIFAAGCQQAGAPGGAGAAPITQLPGQAPMTGPAMPSLGPFGASARVPPPATGSYGNPAGLSGGSLDATPANYAPANIQAMSYHETSGNQIAVAGGAAASDHVGSPGETGWMETGMPPASHFPVNPNMDFSAAPNDLRRGGMVVNDLTGAPPPPGYVGSIGFGAPAGSFAPQPAPPSSNTPGYQPPANLPGQYQTTELSPYPSQDSGGLAPMPAQPPPAQINTPATSAPISGGGFADASPAANQPAFSTADRPVQWQAPRR